MPKFLKPPLLAATLHFAWVVLLKANLVRVRSDASLSELLQFLLPDLAIELGILAAWLLLVGFGKWTGRILGALLLGVTAQLAGLAYGFVVKTGSELSWSLLYYTLTRLSENLAVIRSELHAIDLALFTVPLVILVLALVGRLVRQRQTRPVAWSGGVAVLLGAATLGVESDARHAATVRQSLLAPFFRFRPARTAEPLELVLAPEKLFDDWKLRAKDAPRPNLVVIMMESVRATATSMYPPHFPTTPFLAQKAKEGLLVERAYCTIPHTSKSLLSVFTGHPPKLRLEQKKIWTLPAGGLPHVLGGLGYRSAFFEPSTERFESRRLLIEGLGFDDYRSMEDIVGDRPFEKTHYFGYEDRCLIDPIVDWTKREPGRPFLLAMVNLTTHHDYVTPKTWKKSDYPVASPPPKAERFQLYLNSIRYFDAMLEEMFGKLQAAGALENTVVFFLGDHGQAFGEHGLDGHLDCIWDEGVRIPMVVWGPEKYIGKPRTVGGLRQNLDVLPTIADLLGVPNQWRHDSPARGFSLLAPARADRRIYVSSWYRGGDMAQLIGDRKFVYFAERDELKLFDLSRDPLERSDIASELDTAERNRILDAMLGYRAGVNAWYLTAERAEIQRLRVGELPKLRETRDIAVGTALRVAGFQHVRRTYDTAHFQLRVAIEVVGAPPEGARIELIARDGNATVNVQTVLDPNRLSLAACKPGERILWHARPRIERAGTWQLVLRFRGLTSESIDVDLGTVVVERR